MLPFQRIAVAPPPADWFEGIHRGYFEIYRRALVELGLSVFEVPVDAFIPPDVVRIGKLLSELRDFRPELAMGLHLGSYALVCRMPARRDGSRPNLFTDILEIPTICPWDHSPWQLTAQLLPNPRSPQESTSGALESLRAIVTNPRIIHWSRDSGQTRVMQDLGLLLPNRVIHEMSPSLPGFSPGTARPAEEACFVGHFLQETPDYPHS